MRFGIGPLTFQRAPWDDRSFHDIYAEGVDLVQLAESVGFDSVWVAEHHFADDGFTPSPVGVLGALAGATERIELGTCIALAPFYEPLRLAEDLAVLDQIAGGRVTIGLGLGYREPEFTGYRIDRDSRVQRLIEAVEVCKRAWTQEEFTFEGEVYEYGPATIRPPPAADPRPRIIVGANVPAAVRRAARIADAYLPSRASDLDDVQEQWRIFRDAKADHEPPVGGYELPVTFYGGVADDAETAWERIRAGYAYFDDLHANFRATSPDEWFRVDDPGDAFDEVISPDREAALRDAAFFGSPTDLIERIERLRERFGDELHFIFRPRHPGMEPGHVRESVRRFGEEVIPAVR
ncbi:MAG: LLM class flavin-dependent oxidoreductase [Salinirussus sp.]